MAITRSQSLFAMIALGLLSSNIRPSHCNTFRQASLRQSKSNEGVLFGNASLIFQLDTKSLIQCGAHCALDVENCQVFTLAPSTASPDSVTCRGHSALNSDTSPRAEARLFYILQATVSDWLHRPCVVNEQCQAENTVCFTGKCLCTPGYYYSVSRQLCVDSCATADLQNSYMTYPNKQINGHNSGSSSPLSVSECQAYCNVYSWCRSIDYRHDGYCQLQKVTALQYPSAFVDGNNQYNSLQRMCV